MGMCTKYFFDDENDTETLHNRITIDKKQIDQAKENKNKLLDYLKPSLEYTTGYTIKHWIQGSYKNHTLIRPAFKGEEFDIDIGIYLLSNLEHDGIKAEDIKRIAKELLPKVVKSEPTVRTNESKSNCERIQYEKPVSHIDLPIYYYDEKGKFCRLATEKNGWVDSDPKALQDWFDKKVSHLDANQLARLRRIIRYLKIWIALKWREPSEGKIPSLAITILVANHYVDKDDDEDTFIFTFNEIHRNLKQSFRIKNPLNADDILELNTQQIEVAQNKFDSLKSVCDYVDSVKDKYKAYLYWNKIFEHMFPACVFGNFDGNNTLPVLSHPPKIRVKLFDSSKKVQLENKVNESALACKEEHLYFSIINTEDYPMNCEVRWTVRNQGIEAGMINDLGHSQYLEIRDEAYKETQ